MNMEGIAGMVHSTEEENVLDMVTEESNDLVNEEGIDPVTEERNNLLSEEGNDPVTEQCNTVINEVGNSLLTEERNNLVTEDSNNPVAEETKRTITEESYDSVDFVMKESSSDVVTTNKKPYKRKPPKKKSRRKLFNRRKRRGERFKKELSVLTPEVIVKEEESLSIKPGDFTFNYDPEEDEPIGNVKSEVTTAQETLKHTSVFLVKQEPPSLIDDSVAEPPSLIDDSVVEPPSSIDDSIVNPPVQNPTIRVRKVLLHRKINKSGITVFTPVLSSKLNPVLAKAVQVPTSKLQMMKPVLQKSIREPVLTSCEPELVTLNPQIDHSYFIDESNSQDAPEESFVSMDEPVVNVFKNIRVAGYTIGGKISAVSHTVQPGNIPPVSHMAKSGNIPTLSLVAQPGKIPALTLPYQPGNIPAVSFMAQPRNIPAISLVSQPDSTPTVSRVAQPGNFSAISQPTPCGNIPVASQIPSSSRATLFNGICGPNTSLSTTTVQRNVASSTEQLLEIVGKKLMEIIPSPWITVLRTNGIALCLLNQADIVTIRRSMLIEASGKLTVGVHGKELPPDNPYWNLVITTELRPDNIEEFVAKLHRNFILLRGMEVCRAVEEFQPFWKNMENCEIDQNRFHEVRFNVCCRSTSCQLLVPNLRNKRCTECSKVWKTLSRRSLVDSKKPEGLSLHKPFKYLTSPEKRERFERAVKDIKNLKVANKRLTDKLNQVLHPEMGVPAESLGDNEVSDDAEMSDDNSENVL